jgi:hypothetical protein
LAKFQDVAVVRLTTFIQQNFIFTLGRKIRVKPGFSIGAGVEVDQEFKAAYLSKPAIHAEFIPFVQFRFHSSQSSMTKSRGADRFASIESFYPRFRELKKAKIFTAN